MKIKTLILLIMIVTFASCGGSTGTTSNTGTGGGTTNDTEANAEASRLSTVETDLLALINGERNDDGLPSLLRDVGLDLIMLWHVTQMANNMTLSHTDENGRGAEERVRYYSGDDTVRCSEIIQWWGGTASGQVHYDGYFNSTEHHNAYMENGIYNLGGAEDVGIAAVSGEGPAGSQFEGNSGSYSGLVICNQGVTLDINPFDE